MARASAKKAMNRRRFEINETKRELWESQQGQCACCGAPLGQADHPQLAHLSPQSKSLIRIYGEKVIHNKRNLRMVCSMNCNHKVGLPPSEWHENCQEIMNSLRESACR